MKSLLSAALVALGVLAAAPAHASTAPVADFAGGGNLAIGLAGIAYDQGLGRFSLGGTLGPVVPFAVSGGRIGTFLRAQYRFLDSPELKGAAVAGLLYDAGDPAGRPRAVPDLGLTLAYQLPVIGGFRVTARLGVTMATQGAAPPPLEPVMDLDGGSASAPVPSPPPSFWQSLTYGPNTQASLGIALATDDRYELTLGGGTIVGIRARI